MRCGIALACLMLASPVYASEPPRFAEPLDAFRFEATPDTPRQPGIVHVFNGYTMSGSGDVSRTVRTIKTPVGPVVFEYTATRNNLCAPDCPDTVSVVSAPEGFVVVPATFDVDEQATVQFRLIKFEGL